MRRSSRVIILIGIILAVAAFAGVIYISSNGTQAGTSGGGQQAAPTVKVVVAAVDIPIGTALTSDMLAVKDVQGTTPPAGTYQETGLVVDKVVRQSISKDHVFTTADFLTGTGATSDSVIRGLQKGQRAMSVLVDQVSGVGTLIQPGDRVDVVLGFSIVTYLPAAAPGGLPQKFPENGQLSVKDVIQNVEVLGILPPAVAGAATTAGTATDTGASQSDAAKEIVILGVTAQQAEVLRYAQVQAVVNDGAAAGLNVTLILRATADKDSPPDKTTGITMTQLVNQYGVLPPILPEAGK